jgi:hypothetical protein
MATKPKEYLKLARDHLARAEEDPGDAKNVFVWSFWGLENAIKAAASHVGIEFVKQHWSAGKAARKLAKDHGLPDVEDLLADLNDGRKSAAYGDTDEPDMEPDEVIKQFKDYVERVAAFIKK